MRYKFKLRDNKFSTINYIKDNIQSNRGYLTVLNDRDKFVINDESLHFFDEFRTYVLSEAIELGYPNLELKNFNVNQIDCSLGIRVFNFFESKDIKLNFQLLSDRILWNNISLFVIPDIIYWRFSQKGKVVHSDRFTTHRRRNYIWFILMCCYLFKDNELVDIWSNLKRLGVDEKVQLIERARFGYNEIYYNRLIKKVFSSNQQNSKNLIRTLTPLVTFFQTRYALSFSIPHVDAFIDFLLNEINNENSILLPSSTLDNQLENTEGNSFEIAADPLPNIMYLKKIVNQDIERTASISVEAAKDFFKFENSQVEKRITISMNNSEYLILIKKRDTRMEFRIFLNSLINDSSISEDDILVFYNSSRSDYFNLEIINQNNQEYKEYSSLLGLNNHHVMFL